MELKTYLLIQVLLSVIYFLFGLALFILKDFALGIAVFGIALMFASNWMSNKVKNEKE